MRQGDVHGHSVDSSSNSSSRIGGRTGFLPQLKKSPIETGRKTPKRIPQGSTSSEIFSSVSNLRINTEFIIDGAGNTSSKTVLATRSPTPSKLKPLVLTPKSKKDSSSFVCLSANADEEFKLADIDSSGILTIETFRRWYYSRCVVSKEKSKSSNIAFIAKEKIRLSGGAPPKEERNRPDISEEAQERNGSRSPLVRAQKILAAESAKTDAFAWLMSAETSDTKESVNTTKTPGSASTLSAGKISKMLEVKGTNEEAFNWLVSNKPKGESNGVYGPDADPNLAAPRAKSRSKSDIGVDGTNNRSSGSSASGIRGAHKSGGRTNAAEGDIGVLV